MDSRINGVSTNGGVAYREGIVAGDCPFLEGSPEADTWYNEWDEAADQATSFGNKAKGPGSVVTNRYRAAYSDLGHPTHCGDELAILLNNLCSNKAGTNIELFDAICAANRVSLAKYDRKAKGWQGRLRMTGRNLLAKKVREQGGYLRMPDGDEYKLSQDWLYEAERKFKPKTDQGL